MDYSRLEGFRIINFESIEDAYFSFDERNCILLKAYNNVGKSAVRVALEVLFYDRYKRKQTKFIKTGNYYARLIAYFSDGVIIMRDLYATGQTVYSMYRNSFDDENLIYSTRKGDVIEPVDDVPDIIKKYLGLGYSDGGGNKETLYLNVRRNREKLPLVETSGSENSRFLNEVLHTEEMTLASNLLNTDKNALQSKISRDSLKLEMVRSEYHSLYNLTENLVNALEELDREYEKTSNRYSTLESILNDIKILEDEKGKVIPTLDKINLQQLKDLKYILDDIESINVELPPELSKVDLSRIIEIRNILDSAIQNQKEKAKIIPIVPTVDTQRISQFKTIYTMLQEINGIKYQISEAEKEKKSYLARLDEINDILTKQGIKTMRCNNCGTLQAVEGV